MAAAAARISYGIEETPSGWVLRARLSGAVPDDDRVVLMNWMRDYAAKVKSRYPLAATLFTQEPDGYALQVVMLDRIYPPTRAGRQMSFSYA